MASAWGQHWLDVVRFAESNGYETNSARPNAWPYRDYVIDAFNRDIPYSQFILRANCRRSMRCAGRHRISGGRCPRHGRQPDVELSRQQRHNDLDDFVSTTSQAFMALTVGCAKCHDHKFDPISQRDYYGLQALFSGVFHGERDIPPSTRRTAPAAVRRLARGAGQARARIRILAARSEPLARLDRAQGAAATRRRSARWAMSIASRRSKPGSCDFRSRLPIRREPCLDELEVFAAETGRNVALARPAQKLRPPACWRAEPIRSIKSLMSSTDNTATATVGFRPTWPTAGFRSSWPNRRPSIESNGHAIAKGSMPTACRLAIASKLPCSRASGRPWPPAPIGATFVRRQAEFGSGKPTTGQAEPSELARLRGQAQELRGRLRSWRDRKVYAGTFSAPQTDLCGCIAAKSCSSARRCRRPRPRWSVSRLPLRHRARGRAAAGAGQMAGRSGASVD